MSAGDVAVPRPDECSLAKIEYIKMRIMKVNQVQSEEVDGKGSADGSINRGNEKKISTAYISAP